MVVGIDRQRHGCDAQPLALAPTEIAMGSGDSGSAKKRRSGVHFRELELGVRIHIVIVMCWVRSQQNDVEQGLEGDCGMFSSLKCQC